MQDISFKVKLNKTMLRVHAREKEDLKLDLMKGKARTKLNKLYFKQDFKLKIIKKIQGKSQLLQDSLKMGENQNI